MKLTSKLTLLLLLSIIVSCDKCKKEDTPNQIGTTVLPPATTTGENTMGCLINGEVWLPLKENYFGNLVYDVSFEVAPLSQGGGVSIQAVKGSEVLLVFAEDVTDIGVYYYHNWAYISNYNYANNCGIYRLDSTYINSVEITNLDYSENIVSGLFQMRLINEECDTLTITEGRFDLSEN